MICPTEKFDEGIIAKTRRDSCARIRCLRSSDSEDVILTISARECFSGPSPSRKVAGALLDICRSDVGYYRSCTSVAQKIFELVLNLYKCSTVKLNREVSIECIYEIHKLNFYKLTEQP